MGIYEIMLIIWGGVFLFCLLFDFSTTDFGGICFAIGALFALGIAAIPVVPFWVSIIVFVVVSTISLILFHKFIKKKMQPVGSSVTITDHLIGKHYKLLSSITKEKEGTIKVGDVIWECICEDENEIEKGTYIEVIKIDGNKLVVKIKEG